MELTTTPTETSTKGIGIGTCKTELEPTTTPMETSTRANGSTADLMEKGTIFILLKGVSTRAIGKTAKKKASDNWSLKTSTATQEPGRTTARKEEGHTSIPMENASREIG
jgi:hypothetical protein